MVKVALREGTDSLAIGPNSREHFKSLSVPPTPYEATLGYKYPNQLTGR